MLSQVSDRTTSSTLTTADSYFGPWSRGLGQIYIVTAMVTAFGAYDIKPMFHTLVLGFAFGCLLLAPRQAILDIRVSLISVMMLSLVAASVLWTFDSVTTTFLVRLEVPRSLFLLLVIAVLPLEDTIAGLKKAIWVILGMTIIGLILVPATRSHGILAGSTEPYPGWHGFFLHKNSMSPYLIFALSTLLIWEKSKAARVLGFLTIMVLMVGSQSGTGIGASLFVIAFYIWVVMYRRSSNRWSGGFLIASVGLLFCAAITGAAAIGQISESAGKGSSFSGRTFIWSAVLDAISQRPLLGYGYGGLFQNPPSDTTREIWRNIGFEANHSHSGGLDLLLQLGVVGTVLFGGLFVSTLLGGLGVREDEQRMADWILIVLAVQVLISLSEPVFLGPWMLVMMILRGLTLKTMPSWRQRHGRVATIHGERARIRSEHDDELDYQSVE